MNPKNELNIMIKRLQTAMESSRLSYGEISSLTGIPKSAVHRYISGETVKIPLDRLEKLADALGVSATWLMGWEEPENKINNSDNPKAGKLKNNAGFAILRQEPSFPFDFSDDTLILTNREKKIIMAYRSNPEMQSSILKLLDIDTEISKNKDDNPTSNTHKKTK